MQFNYLLLIDTDKIKEYVFASSKLKEIRGASMLLEYLNVYQTPKTIEAKLKENYKNDYSNNLFKIIYLDGGSGKVEFREEKDAIECGVAISDLYQSFSRTASITWDVVKVNEDYAKTVSFGEFNLRLKKQSGNGATQTFYHGITHRCPHCGIESRENLQKAYKESSQVRNEKFEIIFEEALRNLSYTDGRDSICYSCFTKRVFARNETKEFFITQDDSNESRLPIHTFIENRIQKIYGSSISWPKQLSVIGETSKDGYVAFVYFDGNSMNQVLRRLKGRDKFIEFSSKLRTSIRESLYETIDEVFPFNSLIASRNVDEEEQEETKEKEKVLPLDIIMLAGDDMIAVVPSEKAMAFVSKFQESFALKHDGELTVSAGVAITKASFPIKYIVPFAEQLLRSAKKKNYKLVIEDVKDWRKLSTVDYMVIKSNTNPDLNKIRDEQYTKEIIKKEGKITYKLYMRPFNWETWKEIEGIISNMKHAEKPFPKSKLKSFYELHYIDDWEGLYYFGKYMMNLPVEHRGMLKKFYTLLDYNKEWEETLWIKEKETQYSSPLIDLFEIYPFIEEGGDK